MARRAGNCIEVLLRVYAKFIAGRDEVNNRKIDRFLEGVTYFDTMSAKEEQAED